MRAMSQIKIEDLKAQDPAAHRSAVDRFETSFAQNVNARYAVAVDSFGAAMRYALEIAGVGAGDEIITSPYNSRVTHSAILSLGARPVFADVEEYSLNMNSRLIAGAITGRTRAIVPVHTAGLPADITTIHQIAGEHGLHVIEDAALAFPSEYRGTMVGGTSDFTCFGFHGLGVLCAGNPEWARQCRAKSHPLNEAYAADSLHHLANAESEWIRRTEIARMYNHAFGELPELQIPADRFDCEHAWNLYMLRLNLDLLRINRAEFMEELTRRKIDARMHFIPLHVHPYCSDVQSRQPEDFPVAYRESMREVSLPIRSEMTDIDVGDVICAVTETAEKWGS